MISAISLYKDKQTLCASCFRKVALNKDGLCIGCAYRKPSNNLSPKKEKE